MRFYPLILLAWVCLACFCWCSKLGLLGGGSSDFELWSSGLEKKFKSGSKSGIFGYDSTLAKLLNIFKKNQKYTSVPWLALPESWAWSPPAPPLALSWGLVASRSTFKEAIACSWVAFSSTLPEMENKVLGCKSVKIDFSPFRKLWVERQQTRHFHLGNAELDQRI